MLLFSTLTGEVVNVTSKIYHEASNCEALINRLVIGYINHYMRWDIKSNYQASDRMASTTDYDDRDDDDNVILMIIKFHEVY